MSWNWNVALAIAGVAVFLILVVVALINRNANGTPATAPAATGTGTPATASPAPTDGMGGLTPVVLMVLIAILAWVWVKDDTQPGPSSCPPFSSGEVHTCVLTEKAVTLTTDQLTYEGEFEFCVVKPKQGSYQAKQISTNTFEIRSAHGTLPIQYKFLKGTCPDKF